MEKAGWPNFEAYVKRQRLLDKIGIIIFVIVLVIGVVGGVLGTVLGNEDDAQSSLPQPQQESAVVTPEDSQPQQPLNCGTIRNEAVANLMFEGIPLLEAENEAAGCWEKELSQCNPAYIDWTKETETARLEILRRDANMCVVSQQSFNDKGATTCDVPVTLIEDVIEISQEQKQEAGLILSMNLMLSFGGKYTDTRTGQDMQLNCTP